MALGSPIARGWSVFRLAMSLGWFRRGLYEPSAFRHLDPVWTNPHGSVVKKFDGQGREHRARWDSAAWTSNRRVRGLSESVGFAGEKVRLGHFDDRAVPWLITTHPSYTVRETQERPFEEELVSLVPAFATWLTQQRPDLMAWRGGETGRVTLFDSLLVVPDAEYNAVLPRKPAWFSVVRRFLRPATSLP